jgi:hypothetical protein
MNPDITFEEREKNMGNIRINQLIIIINDIMCSLVMLSFLIFWHIKSAEIVQDLIQNEALPSYHTLIVDKLP